MSALVYRWAAWYSRDLPETVTKERRDELASDIHEHTAWARSEGMPDGRLSRDIASRTVRGIFSDLGWRRMQLRRNDALDPAAGRRRRVNSAALFLVAAVALLIVGWGVAVLSRVGQRVLEGAISPWSDTANGVIAFTVLATLGLALLVRRRTRFIGALWLIVPAIALLHLGTYALISTSVTIMMLTFNLPSWDLLLLALDVSVALLLVGAALWWWPTRSQAPHPAPVVTDAFAPNGVHA